MTLWIQIEDRNPLPGVKLMTRSPPHTHNPASLLIPHCSFCLCARNPFLCWHSSVAFFTFLCYLGLWSPSITQQVCHTSKNTFRFMIATVHYKMVKMPHKAVVLAGEFGGVKLFSGCSVQLRENHITST